MRRSSGEGEEEGTTLVRGRFRPDSSSMALEDLLHDREADSCSFIAGIAVKALENPEKAVCICHVKSNTIVADIIHNSPIIPGRANIHLSDIP